MKRIEKSTDLSAIVSNYLLYRKMLKPQTHLMAVVKANAYGHGALSVSRALADNGCNYFAVATIEEATELRQGNIDGTILILSHIPEEESSLLSKYSITQAVSTFEYAKLLIGDKPINIHIALDTGMSRNGIYCHNSGDIERAYNEIKKISELSNVRITGIFTHFADADNPNGKYTDYQYKNFISVVEYCQSKGIDLGIKHCCNSAATYNYPYMHCDMIRLGICLYGLAPSNETQIPGLIHALELKARIVKINEMFKGDFISYGCTYMAEKNMRTAIVAIGYADGLPRLLSNKGSFLIGNKRAAILGRVCMDLCIVDVTDIDCKEGDYAVICGKELSADSIAEQCGTINYEIVCGFDKPRGSR